MLKFALLAALVAFVTAKPLDVIDDTTRCCKTDEHVKFIQNDAKTLPDCEVICKKLTGHVPIKLPNGRFGCVPANPPCDFVGTGNKGCFECYKHQRCFLLFLTFRKNTKTDIEFKSKNTAGTSSSQENTSTQGQVTKVLKGGGYTTKNINEQEWKKKFGRDSNKETEATIRKATKIQKGKDQLSVEELNRFRQGNGQKFDIEKSDKRFNNGAKTVLGRLPGHHGRGSFISSESTKGSESGVKTNRESTVSNEHLNKKKVIDNGYKVLTTNQRQNQQKNFDRTASNQGQKVDTSFQRLDRTHGKVGISKTSAERSVTSTSGTSSEKGLSKSGSQLHRKSTPNGLFEKESTFGTESSANRFRSGRNTKFGRVETEQKACPHCKSNKVTYTSGQNFENTHGFGKKFKSEGSKRALHITTGPKAQGKELSNKHSIEQEQKTTFTNSGGAQNQVSNQNVYVKKPWLGSETGNIVSKKSSSSSRSERNDERSTKVSREQDLKVFKKNKFRH